LRSALFAVALQQPTWEYFAAAAAPSTVGKSDKLNGEREREAQRFSSCAQELFACERGWLKETWIGKAYYEFAMENDAQSLFCLRNGEGKITFAWLMPEVA
jgi:hypothetical protein